MKRWRLPFARAGCRLKMGLVLAGLGFWAGFAGAQQPVQAPVTVTAEEAGPILDEGPILEDGTVPGDPGAFIQGESGHPTARAFGTWVGVPRLQSGYGVPGQVFYPHTQTAPPTVTPPTQVGPSRYVPPQYPPLQADPDNPRPIRNTLQRFGVGCWSHHNQVGCSSLRSELTFIFGSCRAFFGQPCQHGPPTVPIGGPIPPPNLGPKSPLPEFTINPSISWYFCPANVFGYPAGPQVRTTAPASQATTQPAYPTAAPLPAAARVQ